MEKYTVIIPVRDSAETIRYTLETCLRQNYENFEIVISDNFSSDETREIVASIADHRVKYINTGRRVSMSENFDFALSHVKDGYIMFIGGDDGLMPGAIDYVNEIVVRTGVKAVSGRWSHYIWPNFPDETLCGSIKVCGFGHNTHLKGGVELRNPAEWLRKTLNFETQYVYELANLYYGFVHRSIIDKSVREGIYFRSVTPDAYAAFATTANLDSYAFSYRPFCICGASGKSNGASAFHEKSNTDESQKFTTENTLPIHKNVVYCPSMEVIIVEAFSQFSDAFPERKTGLGVDYELMLRKALASTNAKTREEVLRAAKQMATHHKLILSPQIASPKEDLFSKVRKALPHLKVLASGFSGYIGIKKSTDIYVNDISEASTILGLFVQINNGVKFETVQTQFFSRMKSYLSRTGK